MNQKELREKLNHWLIEFVEKPNSLLNNWPPCPYARQARLTNKIHIVFDSPLEIVTYIPFLDNYDVVVLCFDHTEFPVSQVELFTRHVNSVLIHKDYVVLEDHPDAEELINGVQMNFGECGLMILQKLSKLNNAADQLREKGYYDSWSKENLQDVVNWRYILNSGNS
jgi:hypothetical protein